MLEPDSGSGSEHQVSDQSQLEGPRDYVGGVSWAIFAITFLSWLFLWWANSNSPSPKESRWLIPLFGLPLLGELIGSVALFHRPRKDEKLGIFHWFYLGVIFLCIGSFQAFWGAYLLHKIGQSPFQPRTLSGLALFALILLVGLVITMTLAIMCRPPRERHEKDRWLAKSLLKVTGILHDLKVGAAQEPFLALLLFFTVFLGVSYLFGFTFAFHDKSLAPQNALYMKNLTVPKDRESRTSPEPLKGYFRFEFDNLQAIPDIESNQPNLQTDLEPLAELKRKNFESLDGIVKYITTVKSNDAVRIIVTGHASDPVPKDGPYLSNYELSQARAENVRRKIVEALAAIDSNKWRNIEWLCLSSSNEIEPPKLEHVVRQFRATKNSRGKNSMRRPYVVNISSEDKFADVRIDQPWSQSTTVQMDHFQSDFPNRLNLIDYIYFANYTITTTGYGDIVPLTPYSKFICSLANICEVFFLVVFFNALLSLKGEMSAVRADNGERDSKMSGKSEQLRLLRDLLNRINSIEEKFNRGG